MPGMRVLAIQGVTADQAVRGLLRRSRQADPRAFMVIGAFAGFYAITSFHLPFWVAILFSILISEGLNMVWTLPGTDSWLMVLGISGHAFIVTALLAASFLYYRDGIKWMQFNIQKMTDTMKQQEDGGTTVEPE